MIRPRSRIVAALMLGGVLAWSGALAADRETLAINQILLADFPTLQAYVTVTDANGAAVAGLGVEAFEISEDGERAATQAVAPVRSVGAPMAVVLAIDRSGSMRGAAIQQALAAAEVFVKEMADGDLVGLVSFDDKVTVLSPPTADRQSVLKLLAGIKLGRDTALHDAVAEAVKLLGAIKIQRRAVVVLTDGKENRSKTTLDVLTRAAREARVPVHTVGLGGDVDAKALARLATDTGGLSYFASDPQKLVELYRRIGEVLRNQYVVTFRSPGQLDKRWHRVVISATVRDKILQANLPYLATLDGGANMTAAVAYRSSRQRSLMPLIAGTLGALIVVLSVAIVVVARRRQ